MSAIEYPGPGPQERKRSSQIYFKIFGRWPHAVVAERLGIDLVAAERWLRAMETEHDRRQSP
jgi:hypothetical protein